jgi:hypothetical protein
MFYQSRWYDPSLGRMAQADTIVPGGVQGLDRYAYVNNSPLNYVDPSGHFGQCHDGQSGYQCRINAKKTLQASSTTVIVLFCGVRDGDTCNSDNSPLKNYREWAIANGYQVAYIYDVDADEFDGPLTDDENGSLTGEAHASLRKANVFVKAAGDINNFLKTNPDANFVFIGHSAGADAAILTAHYLLETGRLNHLQGMILLDPSLTATLPGFRNFNLGNMLKDIVRGGVSVFAANSSHYPDESDENVFLKGLLGIRGAYQPYYYKYYYYGDRNHAELATDLTVCTNAINRIGLPGICS